MENIVVVCSNWRVDDNKWSFDVDSKKGSKILPACATTSYENVLQDIHEDYEIDQELHDVVLSYMMPKKLLIKLPKGTPPTYIGKSKQFHVFFQQCKSSPLRLCVEINAKYSRKDVKYSRKDQSEDNQIEDLNPALHSYLERADVRTWSRVHFQGNRYNITTTNIAESLNRVLSSARRLPIVRLLDEIRLMMTRWFCDRRNDAAATKTRLTRGVEKLLEALVLYSKSLNVQAIDAHQYQVTNATSLLVVNLEEKKCTCRRFDLEKLPCAHAIAAAEKAKISRIILASSYFRASYLCKTYGGAVYPKDTSTRLTEEVANQESRPPMVRQPPGRPKNGRIKSALEVAMDKKRPRKQYTCSRCKQVGHNCLSCPLAD